MIEVHIQISSTPAVALQKLSTIIDLLGDDPEINCTWSGWIEPAEDTETSQSKPRSRSRNAKRNSIKNGSLGAAVLSAMRPGENYSSKSFDAATREVGARPNSVSPCLTVLCRAGYIKRTSKDGQLQYYQVTDHGQRTQSRLAKGSKVTFSS